MARTAPRFDLSDVTGQEAPMALTYDSSDVHTAGATASEIPTVMTKGRQFVLRAVAEAVWFRLVKPTEATLIAAVATDGSHYLPAGQEVPVAVIGERTKISVIRGGSNDGAVVLSERPVVV